MQGYPYQDQPTIYLLSAQRVCILEEQSFDWLRLFLSHAYSFALIQSLGHVLASCSRLLTSEVLSIGS